MDFLCNNIVINFQVYQSVDKIELLTVHIPYAMELLFSVLEDHLKTKTKQKKDLATKEKVTFQGIQAWIPFDNAIIYNVLQKELFLEFGKERSHFP